MKRSVQASTGRPTAPLEVLPALPVDLSFPLGEPVNRCALNPVVKPGDDVPCGASLAEGPHLVVHASVSGRVASVDADRILLRHEHDDQPASFATCPRPHAGQLPAFARDMGWVGMGGSMFPTSIKLGAAKRIHTLIINAVECEPGIQIDEALMMHAPDTVRSGIDALRQALSIKRFALALKQPSVAHGMPFATACGAELLRMPDRYPGGAEKLLVARLEGRMPPAGQLPAAIGYLVFSVASLWALGRRLQNGEPSILRPLSLVTRRQTRNLLVPVGTPVGHVLDACKVAVDPGDLIIAGGLMMGRRVDRQSPVLKGTNALFVQPAGERLAKPEQPCIACGSCFDVCPLGLHPIGMADRIRARAQSRALDAQLDECFLCGACSAVCPSDIPLVQIFQQGKTWKRER